MTEKKRNRVLGFRFFGRLGAGFRARGLSKACGWVAPVMPQAEHTHLAASSRFLHRLSSTGELETPHNRDQIQPTMMGFSSLAAWRLPSHPGAVGLRFRA